MHRIALIILVISSLSVFAAVPETPGAETPGGQVAGGDPSQPQGPVNRSHKDTYNKNVFPSSNSATEAGSAISSGLDIRNGGNLDPRLVNKLQSAANGALTQSAYIDKLYADHQITRAEWLALKAGMTAGMMTPINDAAGSVPSQPKITASKSSGQPTITPNASGMDISSSPTEVSVNQPVFGSKRSLASVPESDPNEVGAGAQVLSLSSGGPAIIGTTLVQDKVSETQNAETNKDNGIQKNLQMDENAKGNSTGSQSVILGSASGSKSDKEENHERALLMAQKLLQDQHSKSAKKTGAANAATAKENVGAPTASSVEVAQAKAMASLQNLPKVKRVQGLDGKDSSQGKFSAEEVSAALALSKNRSLASVSGDAGDVEEGLSNTSLFLIGLLGLFAGLAVAYGLFMRPQKSVVQLMVPGAGEHFSIRPGSKEGEFILDIKDIRGKLVKTAGTLRPNSVTRASVLPPDLAARLGAKGNFERFELNADGEFVATEKEEGYQVFPFELNPSKRAS